LRRNENKASARLATSWQRHRFEFGQWRRKLGYIEQTLGHSETLIYKAHCHWLHYGVALIEWALILGLAVWIVFFAPTSWLLYALLLACAAALLFLFRSVLPFLITEIGVTNQRLIVKRGWLARSTDEIALRSIEQVNFQQGFIGRLLGYGQVDVHGTGMDNLIIPPIADPLQFVKSIEDAKGSSKVAADLA
jgi:membrane protein YdbS with pleckstrin-like domain